MIRIILVSSVLLLLSSCDRVGVTGDEIKIYRTRADYSRNMFVTLNTDKTAVSAFPGLDDIELTRLPQKLAKGYYLGTSRNGENGIRSVVTSLTIDTYTSYVSADSLFKLVIDNDPFVEYYYTQKVSIIEFFTNDLGIDTVRLNEVINNNELDKYFNKLK
jgi:hypothetical protein